MTTPQAVHAVMGMFAGFAFLVALFRSFVVVGGMEVVRLERRYLGKKTPEGRTFALSGEQGRQARVLGPGLHFLLPFVYKVTKTPVTQIGSKEIGLIEAIDGHPLTPEALSAIEIVKQIASGNVKITPDVMVGQGSGESGTVAAFIASQMLAKKVVNGNGKS